MSMNAAIKHAVNKLVKTYLEFDRKCKDNFTFVPTNRCGPMDKLIYVISCIGPRGRIWML